MHFSWKSAANYLAHALGVVFLIFNLIAFNGIFKGPQEIGTALLFIGLIAWVPLTFLSKRWFDEHKWSSPYALGNLFLIFLALIWIDMSMVLWHREPLFWGLAIGLVISLPAEWHFKKVPQFIWFLLRLCLLLVGQVLSMFIYAAAY